MSNYVVILGVYILESLTTFLTLKNRKKIINAGVYSIAYSMFSNPKIMQ